jgi:serine protease
MTRIFYLFVCLSLLFKLDVFAQKKLILKLKPEFRTTFENRSGAFAFIFSDLKLNPPKKRFPFHKPLPQTETKANPKLVDLSLIYELEVPMVLASNFTWRQFQNKPELEYAEWEELEAFPLSNPNDPNADSLVGSQRQVLRKIMAYQAWNLSQGDTNTLIGILDTGVPVDHEDLISQIKTNPNDPPNGLDDDQNGLIDDYRGWDFGSNDNNPTPDNTGTAPGHGTSVASLAAGATNNGKGIAGVAYKCKILPVKIWNWAGNFSNFKGYDAIVYAADRGCKVINCSWGSPRINRQYEQDIINYATFNKDALVVAAGGNTPGFLNFLPANYDNVLGVTMTDTTDQIFWAASQNFKLDITAPGVNVFGIQTNGNYGWVEGGSSMASPMVAGAAGLIRSKFPELTGLQAGELLRVNTDTIYSIPGNAGYRDKAGRGRLNILKALQKKQSISLRAVDLDFRTKSGLSARAGDTVLIYVKVQNFLDSISGFEAKVSSISPYLQFIQNTLSFGPMATLSEKWTTMPFVAVISPLMNTVEKAEIRIEVKVANLYVDQRWFIVNINYPYLDLDINQVRSTVVSYNRFGALDISGTIGSGIKYKNVQMFGDAGLMIGTGPSRVSNVVYDTASNDYHFKAETDIRFTNYKNLSQHAVNYSNDSAAGAARIGLRIKQSSFAMKDDSLSGSVFLNYHITNRNSTSIDSICVAQYNDWELENLNANFALWIDSLKLGYTKGKAFRTRFAAVQLLSGGEPQFYAIDALGNTNNGNINLFDGFSIAEKWQTMSKGIGRPNAGQGVNGNNVVQVVGTKLRNFAAGETRKVAFAFLFADSLQELTKRAKANQSFWKQLNTSPSPDSAKFKICKGDTVDYFLGNYAGIKNIKVYSNKTSEDALYEGTGISSRIFKDTSLYVSGNDSVFLGPRVPFKWTSFQKPKGTFQSLSMLPGDSISIDSSLTFKAIDTTGTFKNRWEVNGAVLPDTGISVSILFDSLMQYSICLKQTEPENNCENQTCKTLKVFQLVNTKKEIFPVLFRHYPNPVQGNLFFSSNEKGLVFELSDLLGRKILQEKLDNQTGHIELNNIQSGIYSYKILGRNGSKSGKLVIDN